MIQHGMSNMSKQVGRQVTGSSSSYSYYKQFGPAPGTSYSLDILEYMCWTALNLVFCTERSSRVVL